MAQASVSIYFEAADAAEVEAKMANWVLHEGCRVSVLPMPTPIIFETDASGALREQTPPPPPEVPPETP